MKIQTLLIKLEVTQHVLNHAHLGTDGSGLWVCQIARLKRYRNRISPWIPFELHARVAFHSGPNMELHLLYHLRNILCFFGGWSSAWNFENQRSKSCCPTVHPRHATGPSQETQASVDWVRRRRVKLGIKLPRSEIPGDSQWSMLEDNYSFCWVSLSQGNKMPNGPFQSIDFHQSRSSSPQATMQKHQRKHFWKWWDWQRVLPVIASARGI